MDKIIENAMYKGRETAAAIPAEPQKLDLEVGDFVQILANAKNHVGKVGVIIGIRFKKMDRAGEAILYSVKFSDKDGADFIADNMKFLRRAQDGEI